MRQHLLASGLAAVLSGTAVADVRDIRDLSTPDQPAVFIGFDRAPDFRTMEWEGQTLTLYLDAPTGPARRIEPVQNDLVSSLTAQMTEMGYQVQIGLMTSAHGVDITQTRTGIILRWQAGPALIAEANPTPEAVRSMDQPSISEPANPPGETQQTPVVLAAATPDSVDPCLTAVRGVETDPWDLEALTAHGECLLDAGNSEQAIVHLERVVAFEPGRFSAVMALAAAREQQGETTAAAALYEQAANIAATDGEAVAARARARQLTN